MKRTNVSKKWKCPKCKQHGYVSIYGNQCTNCSNIERMPEFRAREARVAKVMNRKWWEFWK